MLSVPFAAPSNEIARSRLSPNAWKMTHLPTSSGSGAFDRAMRSGPDGVALDVAGDVTAALGVADVEGAATDGDDEITGCCVIGEQAARTKTRARVVLVSAGLRSAALLRGTERLATAAARDGVRVAKREPTAHERVDKVDLGALDVHRAHRVDDDANAVLLDERVVVFAALGEGHAVGEARATARGDVDAKSEVVATLLREDFLELFGGPRGHRDDRLARPGPGLLLLDRHWLHLFQSPGLT